MPFAIRFREKQRVQYGKNTREIRPLGHIKGDEGIIGIKGDLVNPFLFGLLFFLNVIL